MNASLQSQREQGNAEEGVAENRWTSDTRDCSDFSEDVHPSLVQTLKPKQMIEGFVLDRSIFRKIKSKKVSKKFSVFL